VAIFSALIAEPEILLHTTQVSLKIATVARSIIATASLIVQSGT
jgi:hypothetical protein